MITRSRDPLVPCPRCGERYREDDPMCPHCGYPMPEIKAPPKNSDATPQEDRPADTPAAGN